MRPRGPATKYLHMTRDKAEQIRRDYFARRKNQRELAEEHGIKQNSVSRIISGLVWS